MGDVLAGNNTHEVRRTRGSAIANWLMDRKWASFLIILVPTIALALHIPKIEVYSRFADLLPEKHEYIKNYNRMKQTFGGANVVTMALEVKGDKDDIFTYDTLANTCTNTFADTCTNTGDTLANTCTNTDGT